MIGLRAHTYRIIVVNLEHSQIIDLLANLEAETVQRWLETRPAAEIIARDHADS